MLFLHEVHQVAGRREEEFEAVYRDGWMPSLAKGDDARLLYFLHHAHGTANDGHRIDPGVSDASREHRHKTRSAVTQGSGDDLDLRRCHHRGDIHIDPLLGELARQRGH